MKKFLQTTILVALIFTSINASAKSKLTVSTTMPTAMKVIIDGQKFYSQDNYISIRNLQPGYHNISIYYIKTGRDFNNFFNNGNGSYWKKAASRQVVVRNNYQYDITINRFGRAFYDQDYYYSNNNNNNGWRTDGSNTEASDDDEEFDTPDNSFDFNSGYNEDYNDVDFFKKKPNNVVGDNKNYNNTNNYNDDRNNNYNNKYKPMSNEMFAQVKQTLQKTSFESSKLSIAKQVLDNNTISISQVKEIMNILAMETDKLDFAKYAYDKTRDRNSYFTVANGLSMQSDKDELLKYIRDKK